MAQYYTQLNANPHFSLRFVSSLIRRATREGRAYEVENAMRIGETSYSLGFDPQEMELTLQWWEEGREYRQRVALIAEPSNLHSLSGSLVYYFLCPETQTKCRVLYKTIGGGFCSRKALPKALYPLQMKSHKNRYLLYPPEGKEPYRQYGKTHYRGRLTPYGKRCQRWEAAKDRQDIIFFDCITKLVKPKQC